MRPYRGRFAPTPSGPLHLGSVFTALAGFLEARSRGGRWLLRIDDLDPQRSRPGASDAIRRTLECLGLHWDEAVLCQSRRRLAYAAALERLGAARSLYPCTCSRRELAAARGRVYPGTCRNGRAGIPMSPHALRVRTEGAVIALTDRLQGPIRQDLATEVGDFILYRRDQVHAYHLATVLDDAEQGITEVLRGSDLLESTPRQVFLQRQLGLPETVYAHLPVLTDGRGRKLGKSSLAPAVATGRPGALLFELLRLARQEPPASLAPAPPQELLDWAVTHWDSARLAGLRQIAVSDALLARFGAAGGGFR